MTPLAVLGLSHLSLFARYRFTSEYIFSTLPDTVSHAAISETSFEPVNAPTHVDFRESSSNPNINQKSIETVSNLGWVLLVYTQKSARKRNRFTFVSSVDRPLVGYLV